MAARSRATILVLTMAFASACSDDPSTGPDGSNERLAVGGGRQGTDDPPAGGPDDSGPAHPDFDPPPGGVFPLFYSDQDCRSTPGEGVIRSQSDWQEWWAQSIECFGGNDDPPPPLGRPRLSRTPRQHWLFEDDPSDSGVVTPEDPYPTEAPIVDFANNVVLTVAVEADSGFGRSVWVEEVATSASESLIRYVVSELGENCRALVMMPYLSTFSSPTIAVMVPLPLAEPIAWERDDVVYDCTWEPNPNEPVALYYTDATCDLGPSETLITDAAAFEEWVTAALACDEARWYDSDGTTDPSGEGGVDPTVPPGSWSGLQVDFTTHAVIVLRAAPQSRWGGGVWLSGLENDGSGTRVDYTVMDPGDDCPQIEEGGMVQPTVAIRVPLPMASPIVWTKHVETIGCEWGDGTPGGDGPGHGEPGDDGGVDSTGAPPPGL